MSYTLDEAIADCEAQRDPFDLNANGILDAQEMIRRIMAEAEQEGQ